MYDRAEYMYVYVCMIGLSICMYVYVCICMYMYVYVCMIGLSMVPDKVSKFKIGIC